jgi:hypothetical protein
MYTSQKPYLEVYADLGGKYRLVLDGLDQFFISATLTFAQGRSGERLAQLKSWLAAKS